MNEVYLLVGGEATRLQPLSLGIPKALLKIKNIPIIEYIFEEYLKIGNFNISDHALYEIVREMKENVARVAKDYEVE